MSQPVSPPRWPVIALYDRRAAYALLREWTPHHLRDELWAGHFGTQRAPTAAAELEEHLTAWVQRALGALPLRDALLVDEQRGQRVFALICAALTVAQVPVPAALAEHLPADSCDLATLPVELAAVPTLAVLAHRASDERLSIAALTSDLYPFPTDLETLVATVAYGDLAAPFEPPTGWRRVGASLLVAAGVALLVLPLLVGQIPAHPAGLPLALLTLGLLVGIRAGWMGFAGALCFWLVANLPGFRYDSPLLTILWPALPMMGLGLALLSLDRRVRSLWRWVKRQVRGGRRPPPGD